LPGGATGGGDGRQLALRGVREEVRVGAFHVSRIYGKGDLGIHQSLRKSLGVDNFKHHVKKV
jgi:hypothetical protein